MEINVQDFIYIATKITMALKEIRHGEIKMAILLFRHRDFLVVLQGGVL